MAGFTIEAAATAAKVSPVTINHAENGKTNPTPQTLAKLAKAYQCDVDAFFEVDIPAIKKVATSVILDYFNDPEYSKDRKASVAVHLLSALPDAKAEDEVDIDARLEKMIP